MFWNSILIDFSFSSSVALICTFHKNKISNFVAGSIVSESRKKIVSNVKIVDSSNEL